METMKMSNLEIQKLKNILIPFRNFLCTVWEKERCRCEHCLNGDLEFTASQGFCYETSLGVVNLLNETQKDWKIHGDRIVINGQKYGHYWAGNHKSKLIVDLTADQFGKEFPEILITSYPDKRYKKSCAYLDGSDYDWYYKYCIFRGIKP